MKAPCVIVYLTLLTFFSSCTEEKRASYAPPPTYETLHRKGAAGAFFQLEHDGNRYFACSIHQGGAAPGATFLRKESDTAVILEKRVHRQKDLHVWTYETATTAEGDLLPYRAGVTLAVGDRIYFLNRGQKIAATVVQLPTDENFRHTYQTDKPFAAGGMSGSPVYLPRTGSVIGVLQTANDRKKARFGGFELLELP